MCEEGKRALGYDDIALCPRVSYIESRSEVDLSVDLGMGIKLKLPIIAAPMDTVCESNMAIELGNLGGLGIIHRYMSIEKQADEVKRVKESGNLVGFACGIRGRDGDERVDACINAGADLVCIDVAYGATKMVKDKTRELRRKYPDIHIMIGNVANDKHMEYLSANRGPFFDSIRVGIGGGAACTTSRDTGFGLPTVTSIESAKSANISGVKIIADGGIKYSGDIVKALAVGADAVMLGSMLAGHFECPSVIKEGKMVFRGMASEGARRDYNGDHSYHIEGVSMNISPRGRLLDTIKRIEANIKSGLSYGNATNIKDFYEGPQTYYTITPAGFSERLPRNE